MAGFIESYEAAILDHITSGAGTATSPTNWYVGLSTTTPTSTGTNFTEPSGGAYARITVASTSWADAVAGSSSVVDNAIALTFPKATASWGTVTHFGLFTAASGGTPQIWAALGSSATVATDDRMEFAVGQLNVAFGSAP